MLIGSLLVSPWVSRACLVDVLDGLLPKVELPQAQRFLSRRVYDPGQLFVEPVDRVEVVADQRRLEVPGRENHRVVLPGVSRQYLRFSVMYFCEVVTLDIEPAALLAFCSNWASESAWS
jgi:hypothetical protein